MQHLKAIVTHSGLGDFNAVGYLKKKVYAFALYIISNIQ